jgi:energy-coupling factor transport system permease protein
MLWSNGEGTHPFHVGSWLVWLGAAMFAALSTRNPVYLIAILTVALLMLSRLERNIEGEMGRAKGESQSGRSRGLFIRAFVVVTVVVALFKGISAPYGETVLFYLPEFWPFSGNPVTAEGLAWAAIDALQIGTMLAVFAAFSAGADYYALLRATPRALHQAGLVTSIAITFVPQTVTRFLEIREAQAIRGHRIRRVSDLIPLVIPLLGGGMERSLDLAEAMEARGYSRAGDSRALPPIAVQIGIASGLGLTLIGSTLFALWPGGPGALFWLLAAFGVALIGLTLWKVSRGSPRTRYRRGVWREHDLALALAAGLSLCLVLLLRFFTPAAVLYDTFPRLQWPQVDPAALFALVLLAAPILLLARLRHTGSDGHALAAGRAQVGG